MFYFAKIKGEEINEDNTHKLSWKKARKIWTSILDNIKNYDPLGPKPEKIEENFKGNVILENLRPFIETENEEEKEAMNNYSYSLILLVQYVVEILEVRKQDIIRRHDVKKKMENERNAIIEKNQQIDQERQEALNEAKEEFDKEHEEEEKEEEEEEEEEKKEEGEEGENQGEQEPKEEENKGEEEPKEEENKGEEEPKEGEEEEKDENKEGEEGEEGEEYYEEEQIDPGEYDPKNFCHIHKNQPLTHYVEETREIICVYCALNKIQKNKRLTIKEIREKCKEFVKDLDLMLNKSQTYEEKIQNICNEVESDYENESMKIGALYDQLITYLDNTKNNFLKNVESLYETNINNLKAKMTFLNEKEEQIEFLKKELIENSDNVSSEKMSELMGKYNDFIRDSNEINKLEIVINQYNFSHDDENKVIKFFL